MKTTLQTHGGSNVAFAILYMVLLILIPSVSFGQDVKEEWARRYGGSSPTSEHSIHLAVDDKGNSYVTGNSERGSGNNHVDVITVKFSPDGQELWVSRYRNPINAEVKGITVDKAGDVYSWLKRTFSPDPG